MPIRRVHRPAGPSAAPISSSATRASAVAWPKALRKNLKAVRPLVARSEAPIVSLMKGVEKRTGLRMSQVIEQELHCDPARIAVASGPNLALEIAREQPTAAVISSTSRATAEAVARRARNTYFRTFVNTDVIGTEGALTQIA